MSLPEPTLFEVFSGRYEYPPAQRHSPTSIAAAHAIIPDRLTLRERVYRCILANGPITDEGIADELRMNPSTERPRRIELQQQGRVVPSGYQKTKSGRQAVAWAVAK